MFADISLDQNNINFFPQSEAEEILQNVIAVCSTLKGSVPLDREFGIEYAPLDAPVGTAKAVLAAEYIRAVRDFEPRADVVQVKFRDGRNDELLPVFTVRIAG